MKLIKDVTKLTYAQVMKKCGKIAFRIINQTATKEDHVLYQKLQKQAHLLFNKQKNFT